MIASPATGRTGLIGVDIGGTKIAAGLVADGARVTARLSCPTPGTGGRAIVARAADLVDRLLREAPDPVAAVGVGAPGVIDAATGVVSSCTDIVPGWLGTPVAALLSGRVGLPVAVDNDVRAAASAQARDPGVRHYRRVLHVSLGTGVGGALTCAGRVLHGNGGTAGEIAHLLVPEPGDLPCGCGRFDHLEAVAAGPAIVAAYDARAGADGTGADLVTVAARMRAGDPLAREIVARAGALLGRTLSGLVTALDLDALVVAGGAAELGVTLLDPLTRALDTESRPPGRTTPVLRPGTGDAPILGPALLAARRLAGELR